MATETPHTLAGAPTSDTSRHTFPFLDLPLEMREMIYDETLEVFEGELDCGGLKYQASRLGLLLVCKQLESEYSGRAKKKQTLLLQDIRRNTYAEKFNLPYPTATTKVTANIRVQRICFQADIYHHRVWLSKLIEQVPEKVAIEVNIYIAREQLSTKQTVLAPFVQNMVVASTGPVAAHIYVAECDIADHSETTDDFSRVMEWSHELQKFEDTDILDTKDQHQ